jgi:hypothetical protein
MASTRPSYGILQIAVQPGSEDELRDLLAQRGLFLYSVSDGEDGPVYGLGMTTTGTTSRGA